MSVEHSTQALGAIATVIASLIAASVSFVNLTLNKEQKTSEFRQAWIDGLRQDLSTFFACARAFARVTEELRGFGGGNREGAPLAMTDDKISEIRYQAAEARYRIQLRLNFKEDDHKELFRLMQAAVEAQNNTMAGKGDTPTTMKAIEAAAAYAPQILKSEWERVKRGEFAFRMARNWIAPAIFLLSLLFVFALLTGIINL